MSLFVLSLDFTLYCQLSCPRFHTSFMSCSLFECLFWTLRNTKLLATHILKFFQKTYCWFFHITSYTDWHSSSIRKLFSIHLWYKNSTAFKNTDFFFPYLNGNNSLFQFLPSFLLPVLITSLQYFAKISRPFRQFAYCFRGSAKSSHFSMSW